MAGPPSPLPPGAIDPTSGDCHDHAIGRDFSNAHIAEVRDVEIALHIDNHSVGMAEHRRGGWPAIARESRHARAGHGLNAAVGVYFSNSIVIGIGNVNRAVVVDGDSFGLAEYRRERGWAVNRKVAARDGLDDIRICRRVGCRQKSCKAQQRE